MAIALISQISPKRKKEPCAHLKDRKEGRKKGKEERKEGRKGRERKKEREKERGREVESKN